MVSDAYTITDTGPIPPKMADTDISTWYQCIPSVQVLAKAFFPFVMLRMTYIFSLPQPATPGRHKVFSFADGRSWTTKYASVFGKIHCEEYITND